MKFKAPLVAISLLAISACASASKPRQDYASYAAEPVQQMRYAQLYNWQRIDDATAVVWTRPDTAYLLGLTSTCDALRSPVTLQVESDDGIPGRLIAGSGFLSAGKQRCRVASIRPLDLARMKADAKH